MTKEQAYAILLNEILTAARMGAEEANQYNDDLNTGKVLAYYEILANASERAQDLGVTLSEIGMEGVDPEELLKKKKAA